jgi:hypothetical protein
MPTTQSFVCREKPTGSIDSANTTFTLANIPNPNTEQVFLNGVLQNASSNVETNDYVLAGAVITFTAPPQTGDVILVSYLLDIIDIVDDSTDSDGITSNLGRTELIHWCLRRLGAPVIEINVDDDQVEDRIDEALMYFRDYHFDGVERCYLKHRITASTIKLETDYTADIIRGVVLVGDESGATGTAYDKTVDNRTIRFKSTNGVAFKEGETVTVSGQTEKAKVLTATFGDVDNKYVTLNQKVISVTNVIPQQSSTIGGNLGGMFDFQYQFALHNMFNLASTDLVTYDIYKRYISTWEFMFRGTKGIRFNRKTDKVFLDLQDWTVDQYVIFEAWVALDPSTYKEIYMDEFVREYACALVKLQWGTNMKKFSGIGLPGGVTLNGQQLYDEAKAELDVLKDRIKKEFQLPPDFIVG